MARAAQRGDRRASVGSGWRGGLRAAALAALTPLQPTVVSALNIAATEVCPLKTSMCMLCMANVPVKPRLRALHSCGSAYCTAYHLRTHVCSRA